MSQVFLVKLDQSKASWLGLCPWEGSRKQIHKKWLGEDLACKQLPGQAEDRSFSV
jgi:hypothetical protein